MKLELTQRQKDLLNQISGHPSSAGAFSGMIFNHYMPIVLKHPEENTEKYMHIMIKEALNVRIKLAEGLEDDNNN